MRHSLSAAGVLLLVACSAAAQPAPAPGEEFRVNGFSRFIQDESLVQRLGPDNFLVVWRSDVQDGSNAGIYARVLSGAGRRLGPEQRVNAYTTLDQEAPIAAVRPDGREALVAWRDVGRDGDGLGVFARRLDGQGRPLGDDFQVNVATLGRQYQGAAAYDDTGGFVVVWTSGISKTSSACRFDAAGNRVGSELQVANFKATSAQHLPGGGFVVVGQDLAAPDVQARLLDEQGRPLGAEFLVNTFTTGEQLYGQIAPLADGFVVVWQNWPGPGQFVEVAARLYDAAFQPRGAEFRVNEPSLRHEYGPHVGSADDGFVVTWQEESFNPPVFDVRARRFDASGAPRGAEFRVVSGAFANSAAMSEGGRVLVTYEREDILARQVGMIPSSLRVDAAPGSSNGNGILEPGETVTVAPTWANRDQTGWALTGTAVSFTGPGSPGAYSITDAVADYGLVPDGGSASCVGGGNCYGVALASGPRPAAHWDAVLEENLSMGASLRWTLHVGGSFGDVPATSAYYRSVETLLHAGVTTGCGESAYCPSSATTREQMAAFVLTAFEGAGYRPPDCAVPVFGDVPAASPFCRYVEELARRGVTTGCGGGLFCPGAPVTRAETAVFLLRTLDPSLSPPACTTPMFGDVPASSAYCRWIEELARRGVVAGCGGGNYCPDAAVTREQMAVFTTSGFGLSLYAP